MIFLGAASGFVRFVAVALRTRRAEQFVPVRLDVGRFLALGLGFQLASDVLRTAVAPTFQEIAASLDLPPGNGWRAAAGALLAPSSMTPEVRGVGVAGALNRGRTTPNRAAYAIFRGG